MGLAVADKAHTCMSTQKHTQAHTCTLKRGGTIQAFSYWHKQSPCQTAAHQHQHQPEKGGQQNCCDRQNVVCVPLCVCVSVCVCMYVWLEFGFSSGCRGFYVFTVLYIWYCGSLACCWLPTSCRSSLIVFCSFKRSAKGETEWMRWGNLNNQLSD